MKIALFHTTLPEFGRKFRGVEVAVHSLANEWAENENDEVTVFSLSPRPTVAARHRQVYVEAISRSELVDGRTS